MKKLLALLLVLTLCIGAAACSKDAEPTQATTEAPTEASTEAPTETEPIQSVVGNNEPLSTGSGCQPGPEDFAE